MQLWKMQRHMNSADFFQHRPLNANSAAHGEAGYDERAPSTAAVGRQLASAFHLPGARMPLTRSSTADPNY
jgi:hypothetical protein